MYVGYFSIKLEKVGVLWAGGDFVLKSLGTVRGLPQPFSKNLLCARY